MKYLFWAWLLAGMAPVVAQQTWTLSACVEYALAHNLQLQQASVALRQAGLGLQQARDNRLPNLALNTGLNYSLGYSVNPFTNSFESQPITSNNIGLQSTTVLYAGGSLNTSIRRGASDLEARTYDRQQQQNDLTLNVLLAYLQVLNARELVQRTHVQIASTEEQLARTQKLIAAGTLPVVTALDIEAQLATEQLARVNAENQAAQALLQLRQLMALEPGQPLEIEVPALPEPLAQPANPHPDYSPALENFAGLHAGEARMRTAALDIELARAARLPRLVFSAALNSGYSSTFLRRTSSYLDTVVTQVDVSGTPLELRIPQEVPVFGKEPYVGQLWRNRSFQFSLGLSVPIFSRRQNQTNIAQSTLALQSARLQTLQQRQQLEQTLRQTELDLRAAEARYAATDRQIRALEAAFANTTRQFELGLLNSTDFLIAKNNLNRAKFDRVQAKYDVYFRRKILAFYQGDNAYLRWE